MSRGFISVLDSTLRDGAQGENISFSVSDKLQIVRALDEFGVDYIEAGNPSSNPKDTAFFTAASALSLQSAKLCAFGSTRRKGFTAEGDPHVAALLQAGTPAVTIFGKAWELHIADILQVTPEENLAMIFDTIAFFKERGREVIFDAEHFFDGYKDNPRYALRVLEAAEKAGADILCLCDTNGGSLPTEVQAITAAARAAANAPIGIHTHNDSGCAAANSLVAVEAGAAHVQGTFTGFGERCGNGELSAILPALALKSGYRITGELARLSSTAGKIAEISNVQLSARKPYVGASAFSHKAGMHIDGMLKNSASFEHIDPFEVGNQRKFLISEMAGRQGVLEKIKHFAPGLTKDSPELALIVGRLKELEHFGYHFEAADASFALMAKKVLGLFVPHFTLQVFKTTCDFPAGDGDYRSAATVTIAVDGVEETRAATGQGPVNALDIALREALAVFYPGLAKMKLTDYKVRVLDEGRATASKVRVLIESTDALETWSTIGVSADIIEASLIALLDSIEYKLSKGGC